MCCGMRALAAGLKAAPDVHRKATRSAPERGRSEQQQQQKKTAPFMEFFMKMVVPGVLRTRAYVTLRYVVPPSVYPLFSPSVCLSVQLLLMPTFSSK